jgi:hypothetical protein
MIEPTRSHKGQGRTNGSAHGSKSARAAEHKSSAAKVEEPTRGGARSGSRSMGTGRAPQERSSSAGNAGSLRAPRSATAQLTRSQKSAGGRAYGAEQPSGGGRQARSNPDGGARAEDPMGRRSTTGDDTPERDRAETTSQENMASTPAER